MRIIIFILFIIVYFYTYAFNLIRFTVLPTVDKNIAQVIHQKVITTPNTREDCFKQDGEWRKPGLLPKETCMIPYKDGGKLCFAGLQCEARDCVYSSGPSNKTLVATGFCPKYQIYFGCIAKVHFGITDKMICID